MKIAIPLASGRLCQHFGHCESFALIEVDPQTKRILGREDVAAPAHQPGLLPPWLAEWGASVVIAGGMGERARDLFAARDIQVVVGAPAQEPEQIVKDWLAGTLTAGRNACDH